MLSTASLLLTEMKTPVIRELLDELVTFVHVTVVVGIALSFPYDGGNKKSTLTKYNWVIYSREQTRLCISN